MLFWIFDTSMQCGKRARLVNFEGNSVEVVSKVKLSRKNRWKYFPIFGRVLVAVLN